MEQVNNIINKPLQALRQDTKSRIALERLKLAKFCVEMKYKYGVPTKTVMDDIEVVMRRYNGEKVKEKPIKVKK